MTDTRKHRFAVDLLLRIALFFLAILWTAALSAAQQNPAALQITSPTNGTIVNPGQTISVGVTSPANIAFTAVGVVAEDPIGLSNIGTSVPFQFSFTIPANIACRSYALTANATTGTGQRAESNTILIDVERPDMPTSLSTLMQGITFGVIGEKSPVVVLATFSDGSILDVTRSAYLRYFSSDTAIASVDANGIVAAVAPGRASVTATYAQGTQNVQVAVPVTVPAQVLAPSAVSVSFGNQNVGTSSTAQQLTLTNTGNGPLRIISLSATGDFSETDSCTSSSPLAVRSTCTANVTFTPTAAGSRAGGLSIANGANILPAIIPLSGTGIALPVINGLSPTSGFVGTSVTITGVNFGATQGTNTVTFNGTAATPTSWSATSIVATVPTGGTTGNVLVTVGGSPSNGLTFTVQAATSTISVVQHTSRDAGTATSSSLAFSANNIAGNFIGVCIRAGHSGQVFTVTDSRGNTYQKALQLAETLDTPNGHALAIYYAENIRGGANTVTVSDTISDTLQFAILEYSGVATANSLDVTASAQGNSALPNSGNATTTASGDLLLSGISTADARNFTEPSNYVIREFVPAEPNTKLVAQAEVQTAAGVAAASESLSASDPWGAVLAAFKAASAGGGGTAPTITSLSKANGGVGDAITITGTNFGTSQGTSTVTFNGTAATPTNWSSTSIVTSVPSGATTGYVVVTVSGLDSNGAWFTVNVPNPPTITSISPQSGTPGTSVTITGTNFGATQGISTVEFDKTAATPTSWSATSIVTTVPAGAPTGTIAVKVTINGVTSNGVNFTVN